MSKERNEKLGKSVVSFVARNLKKEDIDSLDLSFELLLAAWNLLRSRGVCYGLSSDSAASYAKDQMTNFVESAVKANGKFKEEEPCKR